MVGDIVDSYVIVLLIFVLHLSVFSTSAVVPTSTAAIAATAAPAGLHPVFLITRPSTAFSLTACVPNFSVKGVKKETSKPSTAAPQDP